MTFICIYGGMYRMGSREMRAWGYQCTLLCDGTPRMYMYMVGVRRTNEL